MLRRNDHIVAQKIIKLRQRDRADEAEVGRLNGSRSPSQDRQTAAFRDPIKFNQYIDLVIADDLCRLLVRQRTNDPVMIE